jgi:hypothetical protein
LIALAVMLLTALAFFYYRRYQANAYRRQAVRQLQDLHNEWLVSNNVHIYLGAINALLKSVALRVFPRSDVASRNGAEWVLFLNQTLSAKTAGSHFTEEFAAAHYQAGTPAVNCEDINLTATLWIKQHRVAR